MAEAGTCAAGCSSSTGHAPSATRPGPAAAEPDLPGGDGGARPAHTAPARRSVVPLTLRQARPGRCAAVDRAHGRATRAAAELVDFELPAGFRPRQQQRGALQRGGAIRFRAPRAADRHWRGLLAPAAPVTPLHVRVERTPKVILVQLRTGYDEEDVAVSAGSGIEGLSGPDLPLAVVGGAGVEPTPLYPRKRFLVAADAGSGQAGGRAGGVVEPAATRGWGQRILRAGRT